MSFLNLSTTAVIAGLAVLAALLYLLQQLRVRHTEITVPTTMFWAAAVREAPVRVFRQKFRHFLAYLLLLGICSLLWLGFANPKVDDSRAADYRVLFLDGSAHTSDADEFAAAKQQLAEDLAGLPLGTREVIFGGAHNIKLLTAGEDRVVLDRRLQALAPEAAPSRLGDHLRLMAQNADYPEHVDIIVYGRAPVRQGVLDSLPAGYQVSRATSYSGAGSNRGISALGVADAASGAWDKVDVSVTVTTTPGENVEIADLSFTIGGREGGVAVSRITEGQFVVRDVDANGAIFQASIQGEDKLSLDNVARLTLPTRSVIRVAIHGDPGDSIAGVIAADDGLLLVNSEDDADVVVQTAPRSAAASLPVFAISAIAAQDNAFEIGYTGSHDAEAELADSVSRLGLDQIDNIGLASAVNRAISVSVYPAEQRSISIWSELLDGAYNFTNSRSFPLFFARSLRWLAGETAWYPYLAAGRSAHDQTGRTSLAAGGGAALDALGAAYVPGRAGSLSREGSSALEVSLLSEAVSDLSGGAELRAAANTTVGATSSMGFVTWLILAALLLLAVEWYLYQRGLVP